MDPLTQILWLRSGVNQAHPLLPPVHNLRMINLKEELTKADIDLHEARVALEKFEAAGPSGDTRDLYTAMWKLQEREREYFQRRYLHEHKAVVHGWKAFPKYRVDYADVVGWGTQAVVYGVVNHPDKVVKRYRPAVDLTHYDTVLDEMKNAKLASDKGFGPLHYEISADNKTIDLSEASTIPVFKIDMVFFQVMEKIHEIENKDRQKILKNYINIVNVWKKMRKHGALCQDGFFGHSSIQNTLVMADFGVVKKTNNDTEFITALQEYVTSSVSMGWGHADVVLEYTKHFPKDAFTIEILQPVLKKLTEARLRAAEKERRRKERQEEKERKRQEEKERRRKENEGT